MGRNDKQIYFGDPFVKEYLNEKAFIHCRLSEQELRMVSDLQDKVEEKLYDKIYNITHKSLEKCAHYVWTVDTNDTLYTQYLREPVFVNNEWRGSLIDPLIVGQKLKTSLILAQSFIF
ncbi:hypothetical protein RFI_38972 [Reticulomyxa filosa]|uniref:Uncharacterized protein n=1 Tax=Reticulomyxa filosa TaxID=46433 RepID=X6LAY1_RETFI|nr:hypothetical protein RFI_38972 [Reticulomyxa filosa]|eukprot:ETN98520.1 hypothetical protein RFI_38972 [Reticulomyxa filosa]